MRRILFLLSLLLFGGATLLAQELTVKTFELRDRDLRAKQKPRFDNNEDACALVRVQVAAPNCIFSDSYIVGDVEQGFGEYLVYMAKGARRLRVAHPDFLFTPLDYEFPEALESYRTYALILEVPIYTHYAEIVEQQSQQPQRSTTRTVSTTPVSQSKVWQVGDYYNVNGKEGVVFWVDETGKHGKIVSMTESEQLAYSYNFEELLGASSGSHGDINMSVYKTISAQKSSAYPAFKWCENLGEGWYLPAKKEIDIFLGIGEVLAAVDDTLIQYGGSGLWGRNIEIWSSTERDSESAWLYNLEIEEWGYGLKNYPASVRAVSAF